MIEGGPFGTTCARVACMPSKLLITAAEAVHQIEQAPGFGVHPAGETFINGREVMDRVKRERDRLIVNDDVFNWDDLPGSVGIFGSGVIGLELGQALHHLGIDTKVFGVGGAVGKLTDSAIREYAAKTLGKEFYLDPDINIDIMQREGNKVFIRYQDLDGQMQETIVDYVLAAIGRRPNVDNLGLGNTTLALDAKGVSQADRLTIQTSVPHIFIAGDASNQLPLLHEASDQARIAGQNAGSFPEINPGLRRSAISVVFSDPQIAMVGSTFHELNQKFSALYLESWLK